MSEPVAVHFTDVRYAYPDDEAPALRGIDLEVEPGEALLLVGSSGSGKSTLLRAVNGLVPHSSGGRFGGDVTVGDRSTRTHQPRALADLVGFVHQDPEAQFVVDQVEGDVAFVLENLGYDRDAMRRRVEEALDAVGIAHLRDRSPSTLSGGERQRAALAGALAAAPPVLVLDEPTSELDPQGAEDVLAAVQRLNLDLGTTVIVAEHRLERAAHLVDRAVVLGAGTVTGCGPPGETLADYPGAPPVTHLGRLLGWSELPLTVRDARRMLRAGAPPPPAVPAADDRPAPGAVSVAVRDVTLEQGHRRVLGGVSLELRQGSVIAVLGRNGSGKTTLLRALAGLHEVASGSIDRPASVAYVPQDPNVLLFSPTVRGELEETLRLRNQPDEGRVDAWLTRLGLADVARRHPRSLSAGARQRVAIAAVAVGGADVLLLDEPTRGIDADSAHALRAAIADHARAGGTVVLATHDSELAALVADEVLVLGDGDVVAHGPARTVLAGSLFAPQVLRVAPPHLTVDEVARAIEVVTR